MKRTESDQTHDFFEESFSSQGQEQKQEQEPETEEENLALTKAFPQEPLAGKKLTLSSLGGTLLFLWVVVGHFLGWDTTAVGITVGDAMTGLMTSLGFLFADLRLRKMQKQTLSK